MMITQHSKHGLVPACRPHRKTPLACRALHGSKQPTETPTGIFQLHPNTNVTMLDIRDAVEACDIHASPEERRSCFAVFGLDSHKVDAYYYLVMDMEDKIASDEDDETGRRVSAFGSLLFMLLVFNKVL